MAVTLSNPAIQINDVTFAIVPNTLVVQLGEGETNVRTASTGGGSVTSIHSSNAEDKIGKFMFDIFPTDDVKANIKLWKANIGENGLSATQQLTNGTSQELFLPNASLANDPEINYTADGIVSLEFKGDPIV